MSAFKEKISDAAALTSVYIESYKEYAYRTAYKDDVELLKERMVDKLAATLNE